jgi:hypothetical protein
MKPAAVLLLLALVAAICLLFRGEPTVVPEAMGTTNAAMADEAEAAPPDANPLEVGVAMTREAQVVPPKVEDAARADLRIVVLDDSRPARGATVRIGPLDRITGDDGTAAFPIVEVLRDRQVLVTGEIRVDAAKGARGAFAILPLAVQEAKLELRADDGGWFEGEVVDAMGRPIVGARLTANLTANPRSGSQRVTVTDAAGRFRFDALERVPHAIEVAVGGVVRHAIHVAVPGSRRIVLGESRALTIVVEGPVEGEAVELTLDGYPEEGEFQIASYGASGPSPRFAIEGIPAGVELTASIAADGFAPAIVAVPAPPPHPFVIRLVRVEPLRVRFPGCAGRSARATASALIEFPIAGKRIHWNFGETVTLDATGTATFRRVPGDLGVNLQVHVAPRVGGPELVPVLGGRLDPSAGGDHHFPDFVLYPVRLEREGGAPGPFVLDFQMGPPPNLVLPRPPEYGRGYGILGAQHLVATAGGAIEVDLPLGATYEATLRTIDGGESPVHFEVTAPGPVIVRER